MTAGDTVGIIGACGGAGATRLTVESAAALARDGRSVAVVDAAIATQGLREYVAGDIRPDVTAILLNDESIDDGLVEMALSVDGRVAVIPAAASFERLARAQTPESARSLTTVIDRLARRFDHVLVDAPLVATNATVAVVTATERNAVVVPASKRGAIAAPRIQDRLTDVGTELDVLVANRGAPDSPVENADLTVPESRDTAPQPVPSVVKRDDDFARAIVKFADALVAEPLTVEPDTAGLLGRWRRTTERVSSNE